MAYEDSGEIAAFEMKGIVHTFSYEFVMRVIIKGLYTQRINPAQTFL